MRGCLWLEPFRANRRMLMNQTSEMLLEACSYFTNIHAHKRLLAINKLLTRSEATNILRLVFYFAVYLNIQFWRILVNHRASLCTSKKSFNSLYRIYWEFEIHAPASRGLGAILKMRLVFELSSRFLNVPTFWFWISSFISTIISSENRQKSSRVSSHILVPITSLLNRMMGWLSITHLLKQLIKHTTVF